jgi:hypothetical protein
MKIIITKDQHNRLMETKTINESTNDIEKFKKVAFSIWDNMKKNGERPALIDIIYDLMDLKRNTNGDFKMIRPIWYEYNGGFDVLAKKIYEEIINKTFIITDNVPLLDTKFRVRQINVEEEDHWPLKTLNIICEVDRNGMMEYEDYDEENAEYYIKRDTIQQALYDLEYDDQGLKDYIKGLIYDVLEPITDEKYGIPINIEIELVDFN